MQFEGQCNYENLKLDHYMNERERISKQLASFNNVAIGEQFPGKTLVKETTEILIYGNSFQGYPENLIE